MSKSKKATDGILEYDAKDAKEIKRMKLSRFAIRRVGGERITLSSSEAPGATEQSGSCGRRPVRCQAVAVPPSLSDDGSSSDTRRRLVAA